MLSRYVKENYTQNIQKHKQTFLTLTISFIHRVFPQFYVHPVYGECSSKCVLISFECVSNKKGVFRRPLLLFLVAKEIKRKFIKHIKEKRKSGQTWFHTKSKILFVQILISLWYHYVGIFVYETNFFATYERKCNKEVVYYFIIII